MSENGLDLEQLIAHIQAAKDDVGAAEKTLGALLADLRGSARAEKTTISKTLESAFDRLHAARLRLDSLEESTSSATHREAT